MYVMGMLSARYPPFWKKFILFSACMAAWKDNRFWISVVDFRYLWEFTYRRTAVQCMCCDVHGQEKMYAYVLVQQSGSVHIIVATCSSVCGVDNLDLCMALWLHVAVYRYQTTDQSEWIIKPSFLAKKILKLTDWGGEKVFQSLKTQRWETISKILNLYWLCQSCSYSRSWAETSSCASCICWLYKL